MDFLKNFKPARNFEAVVKEYEYMTSDVIRVLYEVVEGEFDFTAGQFVNLKFEIEEEDVQRAYSIASAPGSMEFELCVKILPDGKAGNYFSKLKTGDKSTFKGPFGFCTVPDGVEKLVLVATGTGLAPIKAILDQAEVSGHSYQKVDVLFGVRKMEDVFYKEALEKWAKKYDVKICLSREDGLEVNDMYKKGRVTKFVKELIEKDSHVYLCGSSAMIKEVRAIAVGAGVENKNIHVEIFD